MQPQPSPATASARSRDTPREGSETLFPPVTAVRVVDGYGVKISVYRGRLRVEDGIGRHRRSDLYTRATCPFKRLLILGHTGYVTLEAVRWCWDLGISITHIDADRNLLLTSAKREVGTNRLRRVQALAPFTEVGVEVARLVFSKKLQGQRTVVMRLPGGDRAAAVIDSALAAVQDADTLDQCLVAESTAALAYWECWTTLPVCFAARDVDRVPEHWQVFGTRSSLVSGTRRHASNPANAALNYAYALLEAETTIALHASGLDPALGIWHRDEAGRDSLTLDVMEAARPAVDRLVLDLVAGEAPLRWRDFRETRQGVCRILPPLTHHLATWSDTVAAAVEPVVLNVGRLFDRIIEPSGDSLSAARPRRAEHRRTAHHARPSSIAAKACKTCGTTLAAGSRDRYCTQCAPKRSASAADAHREAAQRVPQARRDSIRRQRLAALEWDRNHLERPNPDEFTTEILPLVAGVSYSALSRQTGLSRRYCKLIMTGECVPHPVHWPKFTIPRLGSTPNVGA